MFPTMRNSPHFAGPSCGQIELVPSWRAATLAVVWLLVVKSLAAHRLAVRSGRRALIGRVATVRAVPAPIGRVALDGALWRARMWELEGDGVPVAEGSAVVIESIEGLTLTVRPAEEWEVH